MAEPTDERGLRLKIAVILGVAVLLIASAGLRAVRPVLRSQIVPRYTHHRINVNVADAATLAVLPGLGPGLAQRIIEHRDAHGRFTTIDALSAVRLIGPRTIERLRPWVVCGPTSSQ